MKSESFFSPAHAILLVIDVQGKLAEVVHDHENVRRHIETLIKACQILSVPIVCTEQAPQKIGRTVPSIAGLLDGIEPVEKLSFSCCGSPAFAQKLKKLERKQILVAGIESHICVYQTVTDLLRAGYHVQVVADAVSSRTMENKAVSLERMKTLGAGITATEMVICELLKSAEHEKFRDVMKLIK